MGRKFFINVRLTPARKTLVCLALLAAIPALLLREALFGGKGLIPAANPLLSDQYLDFIPLKYFFYTQIRAGRFALWNPFILCGVPSIAAIQSALLFPLNLLTCWIDPFYSSGIVAFLKLWIAGTFTFLYMRRLKASEPASLLSAVIFPFSGYMIVWLGHPHTNSACLLPLLLWLMERAIGGGPRRWAAFSAAFGAMILGGHPPTIVHMTLALTAYFAFRVGFEKHSSREFGYFALAIAGGSLLAAPQLLPYFEYASQSATAESAAALERWSTRLSIGTLTHFFLPYISGDPTVGFEYFTALLGLGPGDNFNERTGYVGLLALFLSAVALTCGRGRWAKFYGGSAAAALAMVYGVPPIPRALRLIPVLNQINPVRMMLFLSFSLSVLAGLGLDALPELCAGRRREHFLIGLGFVLGLLLLWVRAIIAPFTGELMSAEKNFLLTQLPIVIGGFLAAGTAAWYSAPKWRNLAAIGCLAWTLIDLFWFASGYNPAITREQFYPAGDAVKFIQNDPSLFRILGLGRGYLPDQGILHGLYDARGQDFNGIKRYEELITGKSGDFSFYTEASAIPAPLASLNVKYVMTPQHWELAGAPLKSVFMGPTDVYLNRNFSPRAFLVPEYRLLAAKAAALERLRSRDFNPRRLVLLEEAPPAAPAGEGQNQRSGAPASADIVEYQPDRVRIEVDAREPSFLILLDSFYPGWKAAINGEPTRIFRADYAFRAVFIPTGRSTVRFDYAPASFRFGLFLFAAALCLYAGLCFMGRAR